MVHENNRVPNHCICPSPLLAVLFNKQCSRTTHETRILNHGDSPIRGEADECVHEARRLPSMGIGAAGAPQGLDQSLRGAGALQPPAHWPRC